MKKFLSLALSLTLCLGLAAPAFAVGNSIQVVNTGIKADGASNEEGYGSLIIYGDLSMDEYGEFIGDPAQIALIDRSGSFVFQYRADPVGIGFVDARFRCSDGIVSLTLDNTYYNGEIPQYYRLDGSSAFILEETEHEYTENGVDYQESTSWLGGPMRDGYAVVIQKLYSSWSNGWSGGIDSSGDNRTLIIDKNGTVTYELSSEYNERLGWGDPEFSTRMSLGWCGEGLFAFFERITGDYEQGDYGFYTVGKGYMDPAGKTVIDLSGRGYTNLAPFHEGLAAVADQTGVGFIDKSGAEVIPCVFDNASIFCGGVCAVQKDGKWGYIDHTGAVVIPMIYDNAYGAGDGLASVVKDGKCGLVDYNNNVVVPFEYDDISSYEGGIAYAIKGGEVYLISGYQQGAQANPTNDALTCNGVLQNPTVYKIGESNYFKIRDLAAILNGTEKQFSVGYDNEKKSVTATTGQGYTKLDGDLAGPPAGQETAEASSDAIYVNGQKVEAEVYKIGGNNYFKLRDLGKAFDFYVGWSQEQGMFIETDKPYSE